MRLPKMRSSHLLKNSSEVCKKYGLRPHAKKCSFSSSSVTFCGRTISEQGIQVGTRHFQVLLVMQQPKAAEELLQFLCGTNWMRNGIQEYYCLVQPLHGLMESIYKEQGKSTKRAIKCFNVDGEWGTEHTESF